MDSLPSEPPGKPSQSPDLSPNDYHFFKHLDNLLQGKPFQNQQETENVFQEFVELQSTDFYTTGTNKLILVGKNMLTIMVHILINKDVLEPSYNDITFMV